MIRNIPVWLGWTLFVLALSTGLSMAATAQGQGVLEGQVVNGTAGGSEIGAGITITLRVFAGSAESESLQTETDAAGRFRFEGLDTGLDRSYLPEVIYQNVRYAPSQPSQFEAGQTELAATVTVYETTDEAGQITLDSGHLIIESFGSMLRVSELYLVGNSGDRTYTGRAGPDGRVVTIRIPLPEEAVGVAFGEGTPADRFIQTDAALLDTRPVPPGRESLMIFFSYHLGVDEQAVSLARSYEYPAATLSVLLAQPGLTLQSKQFQSGGPQFFEGRQYDLYTVTGLAANTPLTFKLGVQPAQTPAPVLGGEVGQPVTDNQAALRWIGFALAGLAVGGAIVYPLSTRRPPSVAPSPRLAEHPKARRLLAELADVEEAYEAGEMDEETYRRLRAEKRKAIQALWP